MIDLPDYPSPQSADAAMVDFGGFLTPALGGPVQRVERMGNRFRLTVTMPPMPGAKLGRQWISALIRGKQEGARMPFPLQGFDPGLPGNVQTTGINAGRTLSVNGATPGYAFRSGQFFSIEMDGQHYLHMVAEETIAGEDANATLTIEPMLRRSPPENSPCHFGEPMIEGFIMGDEAMWSMSVGQLIGLSFDLVERA